MKEILLYTKGHCPYCVRAKNLLNTKGLSYKEVNIENDPSFYETLKNKTGHRTVPQIFIGERFVGGFSELSDLEERGELDQWLID